MGKTISPWITVKRASKVKLDALYFVQKAGGYYRPGAAGYADDMADAGVWLGADAKAYLSDQGVTLHPVKPLAAIIQKEMTNHIRRAHTLSVLLDRL